MAAKRSRCWTVLGALLAAAVATRADAEASGWPSWGADIHNTRSYQSPAGRPAITPQNVERLKTLHYLRTDAGVQPPPTTAGDKFLYYPDLKGYLWAADRFTGRVLWMFDVLQFLKGRGIEENSFTAMAARTAVAVDGDVVFAGTLTGGYALCLNRFTGDLVWATQVSAYKYALITASPRVYKGTVFWGVSSEDETVKQAIPSYNLTFVGSFVALDAKTGTVRWRLRLLPDKPGYTGAALWSSEPPIDEGRNSIFIGTGNTYTVPASVEACRKKHVGKRILFPDPCREKGDLSESVVSVDLATGKVNWQFSGSPIDTWTLACGYNVPNFQPFGYKRNRAACPQKPGLDIDFGTSPIFVKGTPGVTPRGLDTLYAGEKSGFVWALDARNGQILWSTATGNGGFLGGIEFGSASDGRRYYYANANSQRQPYFLPALNKTMIMGHVGSLSLLTGEFEWQTPFNCELSWAIAEANGLVYAPCSPLVNQKRGGQLHVLNASNGRVRFSKHGMLGNAAAGVSVVGDRVYVPAGYESDIQGGVYIVGL